MKRKLKGKRYTDETLTLERRKAAMQVFKMCKSSNKDMQPFKKKAEQST